MTDANFRCGETRFNISPAEFCRLFALVVNQNAEPNYQVCVRFLRDHESFDEGDEYGLNAAERKSIYNSLGIKVTIPKKVEDEDSSVGVIVVFGNVENSNLTTGNSNTVGHTCTDGSNLTTIISGDGIIVSNK